MANPHKIGDLSVRFVSDMACGALDRLTTIPAFLPTLAPYPARTLVDYSRDNAQARPRRAALLFKGATLTIQRARRPERQRSPRRSRPRGSDAAIASRSLLPNCPQFFIAEIRRVESGRHRRAAESRSTREHELRGSADASTASKRRHADAVLQRG